MKRLLVALVLLLSLEVCAQGLDTTYAVNQDGEIFALVYQKGNEPVIPEGLRVVEFRLGKEDNAVAPEISQDDAFADSVEYYQDLIDRNKEKGEKYNNTGNILLVSGGVALLLSYVLIFDAVNGSAGPLGVLEVIGGLCAGAVVLPLEITGLGFKIAGKSSGDEAAGYQQKLDSYKRRNTVVELGITPLVDPVSKMVGANLALNF